MTTVVPREALMELIKKSSDGKLTDDSSYTKFIIEAINDQSYMKPENVVDVEQLSMDISYMIHELRKMSQAITDARFQHGVEIEEEELLK